MVLGQSGHPFLRIENGMHVSVGRRLSSDAAGHYLLTCSDDKTARLWDAGTGKLLNTLRVPIGETKEGKLWACALSPDGKIAALAGQTGFEWENAYCIYLVDVQTGDILHRIENLPGAINDLEFSPDGKWMAAGLATKKGVRIYTTGEWREFRKLENYNDRVMNIAFRPGGGLATTCYDGKLRLYDDQFELAMEKSGLPGQKIISVAFNPPGNLMAIGYYDTSIVEVRKVSDLTLLYTPSVEKAEQTKGAFEFLSFSSDGASLYGGGSFFQQDKDSLWKCTIRHWGEAGKGKHQDLLLMNNAINDIKFLPNGTMAVLGTFPDLITILPDNKVKWSQVTGNLKPASDDRSEFMVNSDGSSIGFTPEGLKPIRIDVRNRTVEKIQASYPAFHDTAGGTIVTGWLETFTPAINGKSITFFSQNELCYATDINSNGQQIVLGGAFNLYLANNQAEKLWKTPLPAQAIAVNISGNDKIVVAALVDGTIRWFSMSDGKELLTFFLHADRKRWMLYTPSGYYCASAGAEDILGWHLNNGPAGKPSFYPVSRFREKYYRPDIIDAIFETYNENLAISLANQRAGVNDSRPDSMYIAGKLPPVISISSPANGSTVNSQMVHIQYRINGPSDAPARNIKVLVNGRPVLIQRGIIVKKEGLQELDVNIVPGDCVITLLAENENGTSPEANLYIKYQAPLKPVDNESLKPSLYILSIGISRYANPQYQLGLAAKDAIDFASAVLSQKEKCYKDIFVRTLTDHDASKVNILDGLQWIQEKTTRKDVAMIFFAGHGVNDNKGVYYMLPEDADLQRLRATSINFEEIKQTQSTIEGKVLVFIDACHSGNIMGTGGNDMNGLINLLTSTVKGAGSITFTSSTSTEVSFEDKSWGNGAFTKALIEGLKGAASVGEDKEITYTSLSLYISQRVKKMTNDKQHPTLVPTPNTPDFTIAVK